MSKKEVKKNIYSAKEGFVFKSKVDGAVLSNTVILGVEDSIENYEEVLIEEEIEDGES